MRKYYVPILLPDVIAHIGVWFLLRYRRLRYGRVFMRIKLTKGKFAIVDSVDFEYLNQYRWHAKMGGHTFYAARKAIIAGRERTVNMHRLIMNAPRGIFIDHINHNGLDNRRQNLRFATAQQNSWNNSVRRPRGSSRYKGVSWNRNKRRWYATICVDGRNKFLGSFKDETEAARIYDEAAKKFRGDFAYLNFP